MQNAHASGHDWRHQRNRAFAAIILATIAVSGLGALVSDGSADPWYQALNKAPGTPPGIAFGIVWPILYTLMAAGACMVWNAAGGWREADQAMMLFFVQLIPNCAWSVLFFHYHLAATALVDILLLLTLTVMMTLAFAKHSKAAAQMQIPYLLWLSFATYLNAWVVFAN